ncbi:MAG: Nif3-like dinuclear metal center hexameric protein [Ginsengibacter sp.]
MKISTVIQHLEIFAPAALQEAYDNAGLLTGSDQWECTGIIVALDTTEDVVAEAISKKCNLIIAHHPIIFKGLKKITGKNYVERTVISAIKNDVAIYAIHTNLDNVIRGVNGKIAELLGLKNLTILKPTELPLKKLVTFAPLKEAEKIRSALFAAGAGRLGKYSECSFNIEGTGTFTAGDGADPHVGNIGKRHEEREMKIEVIFNAYLQDKIVKAMIEAHPYEEAAYDIFQLSNYLADTGSGLLGELPEATDEISLLQKIKSSFNLKVIKHTRFTGNKVKKIALCGGAGSFLIPTAIASQAKVYITSDITYHEFFDADNKILIADIGHYESEQFTIDLLHTNLKEKFVSFAVLKTEVNTNPVHYFT